MRITTSSSKDVAVVEVEGRITMGSNCLIFRDGVMNIIEDGSRMLVLDLHKVEFMDSSGISTLAGIYIESRRWGSSVKLASLNDTCSRLLDVTGLGGVFEIFHTAEEAVKSFLERRIA